MDTKDRRKIGQSSRRVCGFTSGSLDKASRQAPGVFACLLVPFQGGCGLPGAGRAEGPCLSLITELLLDSDEFGRLGCTHAIYQVGYAVSGQGCEFTHKACVIVLVLSVVFVCCLRFSRCLLCAMRARGNYEHSIVRVKKRNGVRTFLQLILLRAVIILFVFTSLYTILILVSLMCSLDSCVRFPS